MPQSQKKKKGKNIIIQLIYIMIQLDFQSESTFSCVDEISVIKDVKMLIEYSF